MNCTLSSLKTDPDVGETTPGTGGTAQWRGLMLVAALALGLRLVYLWQIRTIPFFAQPVGDAAGYLVWAESIARGDWLGQETFYQAPAYPYFLALIGVTLGADPWRIRIVQVVMGTLACVLIAAAGQRWFGRGPGLAAGILLAMYPPAIFFDGLVQKTSLGLLLICALLLVLARADTPCEGEPLRRLRPLGCWLLAGVVLGLLGLTRENALVLGLPILAWLAFGLSRHSWRRRLASTSALAVGAAVVLLPVGVRNYRVGGEFAITTVQAGPNFYIGNSERATGRYVPLVPGHESPPFEREDATDLAQSAVGRPLDPGEVSRYWWRRSWQFIRSQPGAWLALMGTKWLLVWNAYEVPDTESLYVYAAWSPLLGAMTAVWHWGLLLPLAAAGVVLTWPRRGSLWLLYALALCMAAAVALFYIVARYRFPLVPVLVLFAGAALMEGYQRLRGGGLRAVWPAVAAAVVLGIAANLRINPERQLNGMAFQNLGTVMAQRGDIVGARRAFEAALADAPDSAEVHFNLGQACALQGKYDEAVPYYRAALARQPGLIHADYNLAVALESLGQIGQAVVHYRRALQVDPGDEEARDALARLKSEPAAPE
jgi:tetratricopeptide (TPR) repeat protein